MKKILVLCTGNSCRSQMAHGFLKTLLAGKAEVFSAGLETHGLNPGAVAAMREAGVDISGHTSNHLSEYQNLNFDFVITVCDHAQEHCPVFPGTAVKLHQNFSDPSKIVGSQAEKEAAFRQTREEIRQYCENFARQYFQ